MAHTPSGDAATPRPENGARAERSAGRERPEQLRLPVPVPVAAAPAPPAAPRTPRRAARQLALPVTPAPTQPLRPGPRGPAARGTRAGERDTAAATRAGERDVAATRTGEREAAASIGGRDAAAARAGEARAGKVRAGLAAPGRKRPGAAGARAGAPAAAVPPGEPRARTDVTFGEEPVGGEASAPGTRAVPSGRPAADGPAADRPGVAQPPHEPPAAPPPAVVPRQPAPGGAAVPGEDVHPVLRKAGAPPAARDLLDRAREELAAARAQSGAERYAAAHRAALRAASAALAVHGPPPGARPRGRRGIRSAWETLADAVPGLAPWTLLFTASAAHRARAEAGLHDPATTTRAEELLRAAEDFTGEVATLLDLPRAGEDAADGDPARPTRAPGSPRNRLSPPLRPSTPQETRV
ncbi:SAV_6107 family HEPN domain-containing protein [Streptomyces sp. P6-2-1]|uniref:SAV_6107 family HEPN domain-containing protein n=1 Tax=Streptomyces sp. P6-2-1 TaxID=3422591 RepID=UPI003D36E8C0